MRVLLDTNIVNRLIQRGHAQHAEAVEALFTLLRDERAIFEHWQELVVQFDVKGKNGHDARLVAAMKRHKIAWHLRWYWRASVYRILPLYLHQTPNSFRPVKFAQALGSAGR